MVATERSRGNSDLWTLRRRPHPPPV